MQKINPLLVMIKASEVRQFKEGQIITFKKFEKIAKKVLEENTEDEENNVDVTIIFNSSETFNFQIGISSSNLDVTDCGLESTIRMVLDNVERRISKGHPTVISLDRYNFLRRIEFPSRDTALAKTGVAVTGKRKAK